LRERTDDVPLLVESFLADHAYNRLPDGSRKCSHVSPEALELLQTYRWPGNVRELVNAVERAVSFASSEVIRAEDLPEAIRNAEPSKTSLRVTDPGRPRSQKDAPSRPEGTPTPPSTTSLPAAGAPVAAPTAAAPLVPQTDLPFKDAKEIWVAAFEREYLVHLLRKNRGNISHAAREAEIDRKYFRKLMRKYDIEGPREDPLEEEE
jgi:DNA-binding NtrC family response regulator